MSDLRIIHKNAANDATLTASTTAGALAARNMLNDRKGSFHRSTGLVVQYTLTWDVLRTIGGVGFPAIAVTTDSTVRVWCYDAAAGGVLTMDTGLQWLAPGASLGTWDWAMDLNESPSPVGAMVKAACWFTDHVVARRVVIEVADLTNPSGRIDCARLVVGGFWEPENSADYGVVTGVTDSSKNSRTGAGDLPSDKASKNDSLKLDMSVMSPRDRARMHFILNQNGITVPVFISLAANSEDSLLERDSMIYGKRQNSPVAFASYNLHSTSITIEGW